MNGVVSRKGELKWLREQVPALSNAVDALTAENVELATERDALKTRVEELEDAVRRFVVIQDTIDELECLGSFGLCNLETVRSIEVTKQESVSALRAVVEHVTRVLPGMRIRATSVRGGQ